MEKTGVIVILLLERSTISISGIIYLGLYLDCTEILTFFFLHKNGISLQRLLVS